MTIPFEGNEKYYHLNQTYFNFVVMFALMALAGGMLNVLAVASNDGRMPFQYDESYETKTHFSFSNSEDISNYHLTDNIQIKNHFLSIGDLMMAVGVFGMGFFYLILLFRWIDRIHKNNTVREM